MQQCRKRAPLMLYPKEEARGLRIPRLLGKFKLGDVTEPGHSSSLAFHTKTKRPVRLRVRGVRAPLARCKQVLSCCFTLKGGGTTAIYLCPSVKPSLPDEVRSIYYQLISTSLAPCRHALGGGIQPAIALLKAVSGSSATRAITEVLPCCCFLALQYSNRPAFHCLGE